MTRSDLRILPVFLLLLSWALIPSCSEKIMPEEGLSTGVDIRTPLNVPAEEAQAVTYVLTVTGPGILEPIVADLYYDDGYLLGNIMVPAGPARSFRIEAFDQAGGLVYSGVSVADVETGSEFVLTIDLFPVVPMIKLSPVFFETLQGDMVAMKIRGYNLPDVGAINLMIESHRVEGNYYLSWEYFTLNPALSDILSYDTSRGEGGEIYIYLSLQSELASIVDAEGYVEIGTVYYTTQMWEEFPYETVHFYPYVTYMEDKSGNTLPVETVHMEISTVLLYDYTARYIARYPMTNESPTGGCDPNILDAANDHDGLAIGTTCDPYGKIGDARTFDGKSAYITVPDDDLLDLGEEITISMWVNLPYSGELQHTSPLVSKGGENDLNYELSIINRYTGDGNYSIEFRYGEDRRYATWEALIPDNVEGWMYLAFTCRFDDPSSARAFFGWDCGLIEYEGQWMDYGSTGPGDAPPFTSGPLLIGMNNDDVPAFYAGGIDELQIHDIYFTDAIVQYYDYCY